MSFFISDALAATGTTASSQGGMESIFMIGGLIVVFYLLIWWPQNKRMKEHRNLINNLARGDEILTSGGMLGKITRISDDFLMIMIASDVEISIQKTSVAATVPKGTFKPQNSGSDK